MLSCREVPEKATQAEEPSAADYAEIGRNKLYVEWDYDGAKEALLKAVEMNPQDALSHANIAWYWMLEGNKEKSLEHIRMAKQAAPDDHLWVQWHGWICYFYDDFECAEQYLKESIEMQPEQRDAYFVMGRMNLLNGNRDAAVEYLELAARDSTGRPARAMLHIVKGEEEQAREIMAQIEADGQNSLESLVMVPLNNLLGDRDRALDWLEINYERRQPLLPWLRFMPIMRPLHDEPRFQALVAKIGEPGTGG